MPWWTLAWLGMLPTPSWLVPMSWAVWSYALVHGAAAARVAAPFVFGDAHRVLLLVSAFAWAAAFGLFAFRYWPILATPRVDGRPESS